QSRMFPPIPRMPVLGVSWHDAVAYCEWRSKRESREIRLPTETEWEKAARGVDGRWFPWGNRFDASLCNMNQSRRERNAPVMVDEYPTDLSVYGVRGMGGNMRDWTSTEEIHGEGNEARHTRVVRGGAWHFTSIGSRCAARNTNGPADVDGDLGFRVCQVARRTRQ
ncbi:formylglycine-generating enzyme family protein, partial [Acidobacteriota bacterium]